MKSIKWFQYVKCSCIQKCATVSRQTILSANQLLYFPTESITTSFLGVRAQPGILLSLAFVYLSLLPFSFSNFLLSQTTSFICFLCFNQQAHE